MGCVEERFFGGGGGSVCVGVGGVGGVGVNRIEIRLGEKQLSFFVFSAGMAAPTTQATPPSTSSGRRWTQRWVGWVGWVELHMG